MDDRIHRHLDGDLPWEGLTEEERRKAEDHRRTLARTVLLLRSEGCPDLSARVMESVSGPSRRTLWYRVQWLWQPRTVSLRPAWGILAAAALLLAVLIPREGELRHGVTGTEGEAAIPVGVPPATPSASPAAVTVLVQFRLEAPDASDVRLAGTFTAWEPYYALQETSPGSWSVFVPLPPGIHDYAFVLDGQRWIPDPAAPGVDDGFGGRNSRLALLPATGARES